MSDYDFIIAGYGPTGAVAANLLGAFGFSVLVVDPNVDVYEIPRAVHFDGETMRIFQALGLAAEINSVAEEASGLRFTNGWNWPLFYQDLSMIERTHGWACDYFFNQPGLERKLRDGVRRYANVDVWLGWALANLTEHSTSVNVSLRHATEHAQAREASCRYLLGCDGASSTTRALVDIALEDLECDEPWLVCDLILDEAQQHQRDAYQICDPARPTTLVPCAGSHIRWEFMLNADDEVDVLEHESRTREMMVPHLHRLSPSIDSDSGKLIRSKVYNFHAVVADSFQSGRVFLLGDAAHQTPPFLGQGMCAGVRDAYNLCWKLAGVLRADYSPALLDTYTSERRAQVREVVATAIKHGSVIQTRNRAKALLRDCFLMLGRAWPPLIGFLRFGEGWYIGEGLLSCDNPRAAGGAIGKPIPQPIVETGHGKKRLDELLGDNFSVIGIGVDPAAMINGDADRLPLTTLQIGKDSRIQEVDKSLRDWARGHGVSVAVIRPDRQVYGICNAATEDELRVQLSSLLARLDDTLFH